jgi:hypothetical protein
MAFTSIPSSLVAVGKSVKTELFSYIKDNFDDHESRLSALSIGSSPIEIFNFPVLNASSATTLTGLTYYRAVTAFSVSSVQIEIFEKGGIVSGSLTVDVKKSTAGLGGTFTSILTVQPTLNFASISDYATNAGTLNGALQSINSGDYLRLDVTALPTVPLTRFRVFVYGTI